MKNAEIIALYAMQMKPLSEELGGGYEAFYTQLARSVVGHGATPQEALSDLDAMLPDFIDVLEETGQTLAMPEPPREWSGFSGKFNVRVSKMLHCQLVNLAEEQEVSLNALIQMILTSGVTMLGCGQEFGAIQSKQQIAAPKGQWRMENSDRSSNTPVQEQQIGFRERVTDNWRVTVQGSGNLDV